MLPAMDIDQLTDGELLAMITLAKAMVHADGVVTNEEMVDLVSLGEVMGMARFTAALDAAAPYYRDWNSVFGMADTVVRHDARVLIYCLLEELAKGDGMGGIEQQVLDELRRRWRFE